METADIALQAAQTGHLLLSTLHTNDAAATDYPAVRSGHAAVHRRGVACRHRRRSGWCGGSARRARCRRLRAPRSCRRSAARRGCRRTRRGSSGAAARSAGTRAMKGRLAIHEVLPVNDEVRALIASQAPEQDDPDGSQTRRHAHAARGRHRESGPGPHDDRGAPVRRSARRGPRDAESGRDRSPTAASATAVDWLHRAQPRPRRRPAGGTGSACSSSKTVRRSRRSSSTSSSSRASR